MTNEQYLIVSYFVIGLISLGVALGAYLWLRRSFTSITQVVPLRHFSQMLRNLFIVGIVLPALFGFFSVSFHSCSIDTYEEIIKERAYLVAKNQEQLSSSLFYIVVALLTWGFIVGGTLFIAKRRKNGKQ